MIEKQAKIGQGTFGEVFKARDKRSQQANKISQLDRSPHHLGNTLLILIYHKYQFSI